MSSEDLILDIMYKAHSIGIHEHVFKKVTELSGSLRIYDTQQRAAIYEQAYKLVIDERTNNQSII
jgi:hypothetical protein